MVSLLWTITYPSLTGAELFQLEEDGPTRMLRGAVVAKFEGVDIALEYGIDADEHWLTRRVDINVSFPESRTVTIEHDGKGEWSVDGERAPDLDGCLDVDLGISPSTNTLPIRRLGLDVGEAADLVAAWVRFPEVTVETLPQRYERIADSTYRYSSDSFEADLEVDDRGVVLRYGEDLWQVMPNQPFD